jgi:protein-disulfide isomerase
MPAPAPPPAPPETFYHRWKTLIWLGVVFTGILFVLAFWVLISQQAQLIQGSPQGSTSQLSVDANATGTESTDAAVAISNFADDPSVGPDDAPLTIVAFEDFQCPFCQAQQATLRQALQQFDGQVRFVYRDFPIAAIHPEAQKAAEAAQCAQEQGFFWEYHDVLFANQSRQSIPDLKRYAQTLRLDTIQFDRCLDEGVYAQEVLDDYQDGLRAGVTGTPTFFFNGEKLAGVITLEGFQEIVQYYVNQ